jgi:hypothetical protein
MDDKIELAALMQRIAGSLEGIDKAVQEIQSALQTMRERAEAELRQRTLQLNAITATQKFQSGRWTRRDGDGFGTLPRSTSPLATEVEAAKNGDGTSGNL